MRLIAALLIIWNVFTFLIMGIDKYKSKHQKQRIRERTLLLSAFAFGGFGSLFGSLLFRHKTKKLKFQILLPCAAIIQLILLIYYFWIN